jgi:phytoene dehydrogenase-like protein/NAD-dependent dihydropyrimidine dehydrogenase PreA subunit
MQLIKERCTGCGYCILVCPYDALKSDGWAEVIPANCTDCNLCVYACPNDCFVPEPETPVKAYQPRLKSDYDVTIIGSGIGGLMAGVALAQAGRSVAVFEKLGFPGGRYTEIDYKGAAVTTGAWTNLGPKSHIGRFLTGLGIELDYISLKDAGLSEQYTIRFPDGRQYASLFAMLSSPARRAWLKAILKGKQQMEAANPQRDGNESAHVDSPFAHSLDHISTADYIAQFSTDPDLLATVDTIAATASGLNSTALPASEYIQITLDGREAGSEFAMPAGGVRAIIKGLTGALRQAGGQLFVRSPVTQILLEPASLSSQEPESLMASVTSEGEAGPWSAIGLKLADGREVRSRIVLHNGGPGAFIKLAGSQHLPWAYLDKLTVLKGVECAALFCATREPLFRDAPITMTPGCRRIVGIFSPTVLDPGLSKDGLHLVDAFFPTCGDDRTAELELARADLRDLFPNFEEVVEWTVPMFFTGAWPGTESGQIFGQTGDCRLDPVTPIQNCFLVGMDVKGSGIAGDLIPLGVRQLLARLELKM